MRQIATFAALVLFAAPQPAEARGADGHFEERSSSHFVLLQDVDIERSAELLRTKKLDRALRRIYRLDSAELEARLFAELS